MKLLVFTLFLIFVFMLHPVNSASTEWLQNTGFMNPLIDFDTGTLYDVQIHELPDNWHWGYHCYSWTWEQELPISECQVKSYEARENDYNVRLSARMDEHEDRIGVVALRQYNDELPISGKEIWVETWLNRGESREFPGHCIYQLEVRLKDYSNNQQLVLALIPWGSYWPATNTFPKGTTFYYNAYFPLGCHMFLENTWYNCNFKLSDYIDDAINVAKTHGLNFNKNSLKIFRTEMHVEVKKVSIINGYGNLEIGSLRLYHKPIPTTRSGGCGGSPWNRCFRLGASEYPLYVIILPIIIIIAMFGVLGVLNKKYKR
jgi:hypothetical protein